MEQIFLYKTFNFRTIQFTSFHHTDNSKGISCHFIARMRSGSGIIKTIDGNELCLKAGDIFYLPMGLQYHSYWNFDKTKEQSVSWESYGFIHWPVHNEVRYIMQKISPSEVAIQWLDHLYLNQAVSPASVGYLYLFLSEVLPKFQIAELDSKSILLQKAFNYIHQNENFTVPELAHSCGISESGIYSLFRDYANTTPIEFKHHLISERAVSLLTTTDMSVEMIANTLGLCSSAYLRRILKKQINQTPSQIRKNSKII